MTPANALFSPIFAHGFYLSPREAILLCLFLLGPFVLSGLFVLSAIILRFWRRTAAGVCLLLAASFSLIGCYLWMIAIGGALLKGSLPESLFPQLFRPEYQPYSVLGMTSILVGMLSIIDLNPRLRRRVGGGRCFTLGATIAVPPLLFFLGPYFFNFSPPVLAVVLQLWLLFLVGTMSIAGAVLKVRKMPGAWFFWVLAMLVAGSFAIFVPWDDVVRFLAS